mmetsp:Transcript_11262/g.26465  ORF Transcript_11262/g.26465 Transcript_11262/m.26465 type:complete len:455 (-) Transcript_11262:261-1625(-)
MRKISGLTTRSRTPGNALLMPSPEQTHFCPLVSCVFSFEAWDLLGEPMGDFWRWLDESDYELEVCPRALLERDTVHYCASQAEADGYALRIAPPESEKADATLRHADTGAPLDTGPNGWIFVLKGGVLYAAPKRTDPPRFHHSSFFAGRCVQVAGILVTDQERTGRLRKLFPHSGHYRPGDRHIQYILRFLQSACLDIASIEVDGQHTMKVARLLSREGGRVKKKERPYLVRGDQLLSFLEMKACSTPLFVELVNRVARDKKRGVSNSGQERRDHRGGRGAWAPETIHRSEGGSGGGVLVESSADTDTSVEVEAGELRGSSGEPSGEPSGRLGKELERGAEERRATLGRRDPLPPTPGLTPGRLGTSLEGSSFLRGGGGFMRTSSDNSLVSLEEHSPPGALATYPGVPGCEDDALEELAFGLDDLDDLAMAHHGAVPNGAGGQRLGSYAALEAP